MVKNKTLYSCFISFILVFKKINYLLKLLVIMHVLIEEYL